jgi:hypothetical protein
VGKLVEFAIHGEGDIKIARSIQEKNLVLGGVDGEDEIDIGAGGKRQSVIAIIDATEINSKGGVERSVRGGFDMLRGNFDFDIGEDLELIIYSLIIVLQCVEIGVAKEDSLELVVGGFRGCERRGEGEEIVVGLEISFLERGFEKVWTRLGLVGRFVVRVFLIGVISVCVILAGVSEILLYSIEIRVTSEEAEWSDGFSVVFREIRILEGDEAVFFVVGFVRADFGKVIVIFEEEEGEDRGGNYNDNLED